MTPQRWQKVKEICHLALDRKPGQRTEVLVEACSDDQGLRHEVESLTPSSKLWRSATMIARSSTLSGIEVSQWSLVRPKRRLWWSHSQPSSKGHTR